MEDLKGESSPDYGISFMDFPEDVQLAILSFLSPSEISSFCVTSKRFACYTRHDSKVWHSLCDRRWGCKTQICSWSHNGKVPFHLLYKTLDRLENLIGFWRRIDQYGKPQSAAANTNNPPSLLFFEWGPYFLTGSEIRLQNRYGVCKKPFLWMGLSDRGDPVNYLHPSVTIPSGLMRNEERGFLKIESWDELDLVPANVSFVGRNHFVVEESSGCVTRNSCGGEGSLNSPRSYEGNSPPDRVTSDIYQYFANRTSPGWDRAYRRQRRRERQRQGKRLWEPEHYVKILNESPTRARPLQGLWKGIDNNQDLCFYIVAYDDIGGITCRRVGDPTGHLSAYSPVFWTANTTFIEPPFSSEERSLYDKRHPGMPSCSLYREKKGEVARIFRINSSYDLVIPSLADSFLGASMTEGRIWQYRDGTFAFGFPRDPCTIDLRQAASNGRLLDEE